MYELSQYAFLADRNGGSGLTWAKLHDPGCGMITVWAIFAAEWVLFMTNAWYLDQVRTGSRLEVKVLMFFPPVSSRLLLFTLFMTNAVTWIRCVLDPSCKLNLLLSFHLFLSP